MIKKNGRCILEAHRGVSSDYPENTLAAYRAAVDLGYGMIELDARFTADNRCVMMHDKTLRRTTRLPDGSEHEQNIPIAEADFAFVRSLDAGLHKGEQFRGECVPTLEEVIALSRESGVPLKFDNILQSYTDAQLSVFLGTVGSMNAWSHVGFTVSSVDFARRILAYEPSAHIHFDGPLSGENLTALASLLPREQITVWGRFDNRITAWCKTPPVDRAMAERVHTFASLGIWLLATREEYDAAVRTFDADIVETNGQLKP